MITAFLISMAIVMISFCILFLLGILIYSKLMGNKFGKYCPNQFWLPKLMIGSGAVFVVSLAVAMGILFS